MTPPPRQRQRRSKRDKCPICDQRDVGGGEIFRIEDDVGSSVYDLQRAKEIAMDGRVARRVPERDLMKLVSVWQIESEHLEHVDPDSPGIIGQRFSGPLLLDGAYRATVCVQQHRAFSAYYLSPEETKSCILSEDIGRTDIGVAVARVRRVLAENPDQFVEVEIDGGPKALRYFRSLLSAEENKRIILKSKDTQAKS